MSYILEALRRAQAERERGHVPGLHAQPVAADTMHDARRAAPAPWVLWFAGGAGLLVLVALLLWWTRPAPVVVVAAAPADVPATTAAPSMTATPNATPSAMPSDPAGSTLAQSPAPVRSLPIVISAPPVAAAPAPARAPVRAAAPAVPAAALPPTAAVPPSPSPAQLSATVPPGITPVTAPPRSTRLPTVSELSPDQRRELPPLVLGGSVWSDNAISRFVIFNGQIVHEGQPAAPGVVVERIAPKAAQLRWRGVLFEVPL